MKRAKQKKVGGAKAAKVRATRAVSARVKKVDRRSAKPPQRKADVPRGKKPPTKYVYFFGGGRGDGNAGMKNLLGGKGANLHEMAALGLPVPPGFTVSTEVCTHFYANGRRYPASLRNEVVRTLARVEELVGRRF